MVSLCATALCSYVHKCPFLHLPSVYSSHPAFQHISCFQVTEEFQTNLTDQSLKKTKYVPVMQNQSTVKTCSAYIRTENHRISGVGSDLSRSFNPPAQRRARWGMLPRTVSSQLLSISKDGDSTASLGNFFHCLPTLTVKEVFSCASDEISWVICASFAVTGHYWENCSSLT